LDTNFCGVSQEKKKKGEEQRRSCREGGLNEQEAEWSGAGRGGNGREENKEGAVGVLGFLRQRKRSN
jgi:hypothetical protein